MRDFLSSTDIYPLGDTGATVRFSEAINRIAHKYVFTLFKLIEELSPNWVVEAVPAFTTITIYYNPFKIKVDQYSEHPYEFVQQFLKEQLQSLSMLDQKETLSRLIEIPVCYGEEYGPDLINVCKYHRMEPEEVIHLHSEADYFVYMIGFAPGFPYLGGLSSQIATPRRKTPRLAIPAGSVGIAGAQTGVYPIETPGGWQIIGRTPLSLFEPKSKKPSLLNAGDTIRFYPISDDDYRTWGDER